MENRREDFFRDKKCLKCKTNKNLELHHRDPSKKESHRIWSWRQDRRHREIEKCDILCRECHKIETKKYLFKLFTKPLRHGTALAYKKYKCKCKRCKTEQAKKRREHYLRTGK